MSIITDKRVLTIPGLSGSSADHWQSLWEKDHPHFRRVEQQSWDTPILSEWLETLNRALRSSDQPAVLVAHSLGCALVAHWLARADHPERLVSGALLVAPPNVDQCGEHIRAFAPLPHLALPIPLTLVASTSDPFAEISFARTVARQWQAELVDVGAQGHINVNSGHGPWPEGQALLASLLAPRDRPSPPGQGSSPGDHASPTAPAFKRAPG